MGATELQDEVLQGGTWQPRSWTTASDGTLRSSTYHGVPQPKPISLKEVGECHGRMGRGRTQMYLCTKMMLCGRADMAKYEDHNRHVSFMH